MIEMFVNNRSLVLPKDLKIRIEINSPAFESDTLPASVIYCFDLPISQNEDILGYANYTEIKSKYREYPWKMRYENFWLFSGILVVTNISNIFRCAATIKQLPTDFSDQNITDFDYDNIDITTTMSDFVNQVRQGNNILAFPKIYAPSIYSDNNSSFQGIVNPDTPVENDNGNFHTIIPLFKIVYLLKTIFQAANYKIDYSSVDEIISRLLVFNNYTLDSVPSDYYVFCTITDGIMNTLLNPQIDKHNCINFKKHYVIKEPGQFSITAYINGSIGINSSQNMLIEVVLIKFNAEESEEISIHSFYQKIESVAPFLICDISVNVDLSTEVQEFDLILRSQSVMTGIKHDVHPVSGHIEICRIGATEGQTDKNTYLNSISPKNHLPEINVNDLLLSIRQVLGTACFIDNINPAVQLYMYKHLLHARCLDLTKLFIENSNEISISVPTAHIFKYNIDEISTTGYDSRGTFNSFSFVDAPVRPKLLIEIRQTNSYYISEMVENEMIWKRLGDSFKHLQTAKKNQKEEIELKMTPMSMEVWNNSAYPFYESQGISSMFTPESSPVDKLIFVIQTSATEASSSGINWQGDEIGVSLNLNAKNSFFNRYLKEWYEFIAGANEYSCNFHVNIESMLQILELFKPQIQAPTEQFRRVRIKNQNYIPKQFTFELTHTGITCQAKLMKYDGNK